MRRPAAMNRLLRIAAAAALLACQTLSELGEDGANPDYAKDAAANLKLGQEAYDGNDYANAQRYFEYVATKFPFLDAAKIADLRLGDVALATEEYAAGRERFKTFVRMHPTHPEVDYAALRAAESHFLEAPRPFILLPPAFEKDLTGVKNAVRALNDFLRDYPESEHRDQAKKTLDEARRRLADHELYVAEFYTKRKQWPAVVGRLKNVLNEYPGLGYDEDVLFKLHDAYKAMNDSQGASDALKQIQVRMPGTKAAEKASKLLGS